MCLAAAGVRVTDMVVGGGGFSVILGSAKNMKATQTFQAVLVSVFSL